MSVGWRRQYEVDAVFWFYKLLAVIKALRPNEPGIDEMLRRAKLIAIMQLSQEQIDLKTQDVAHDRIADCKACRERNNGNCYRDMNTKRECIYERADVKLRFILKHYGQEAERWIETAGNLAQERTEAKV